MTAGALRHWRKAVVCWPGAIFLLVAPAADAGWLDRVRGAAMSATGIAIGSYVVHNASVIQSLKENAGELTDLFADMLDVVEEGDTRTADKIWSDVEKVPGDIVKEAFPVFRVADAAATLFAGVKNRLESARRHIERFVEKGGGIDPRGALAISEDEHPLYASTTGIFGDEPLPTVNFSTATNAAAERPWARPREDRHRDGGRSGERPAPTIAVDSQETHDSYHASLKSLEKLWAASRGGTTELAELEGGNYEEALEALDRRRTELKTERRRQVSKDRAKDQSGRPSSEEVAIAPVQTTDDSEESEPPPRTPRTPPGESNGPADAALSRSTPANSETTEQDEFLLTCDSLRSAGMSLCVEYRYEKANEHRAARNQCSSAGYDARLDASCPKGRGASVCLHTTDDSEAVTYDYDPERPKDEFASNCKRTRGEYLGTR